MAVKRDGVVNMTYTDFRYGTTTFFGVTSDGQTVNEPISEMPNLLIIGSKIAKNHKAYVRAMLVSLLVGHAPDQVKLVAADSDTEYLKYLNRQPGMLDNTVASTTDEVEYMLESLERELDDRQKALVKEQKVDIDKYNTWAIVNEKQTLPYIVCYIGNYDVYLNEVERFRRRLLNLANKGERVGIHFIIETSKPTTTILRDDIKTLFPSRLCFKQLNGTTSKSIIGIEKAEDLSQHGEAYLKVEDVCQRISMRPLEDDEVKGLMDYTRLIYR